MQRLLLSLHLAVLMAAGAEAKDPAIVVPADTTACNTEGYAIDKDPAGLNVRAGPSASAPVVARFKYRAKETDAPSVEVHIIGYKDGWLLIEGGSYGDYGGITPPPVYSGKGWVKATMMSGQFIGGAQGLLQEPSYRSPFKHFSAFSDDVGIKHLLACRDHWVKVDTTEGSGWVYGFCSNQVTTCP